MKWVVVYSVQNLETFFKRPEGEHAHPPAHRKEVFRLLPPNILIGNVSKTNHTGTASGRMALSTTTAQARCMHPVRHWHTLRIMAEQNHKIDLCDGQSEKWKENYKKNGGGV